VLGSGDGLANLRLLAASALSLYLSLHHRPGGARVHGPPQRLLLPLLGRVLWLSIGLVGLYEERLFVVGQRNGRLVVGELVEVLLGVGMHDVPNRGGGRLGLQGGCLEAHLQILVGVVGAFFVGCLSDTASQCLGLVRWWLKR